MGNFMHGSSCKKVDSVSKDNTGSLIDIATRNSKMSIINLATYRQHKRPKTRGSNFHPNYSQNYEEFTDDEMRDTQNTKLNDTNFGFAVGTPRNIYVRGVETSSSQQDHHSHSLHRTVRTRLGTFDDQNSQTIAVGMSSKRKKTVNHTHQYKIKVEINNPSANALIIGNDNKVNVIKKEKQPFIEHTKDDSKDSKYTRNNLDEVSFINQQMDETDDEFKASMTKNAARTINIGCGKLRKSRSAVSSRHPKSFRHFAKKSSSTVDPRTMPQNFEWDQYEMIQESLLRTVSCEIKKCGSEETLAKKVSEIKYKFQNTIDQLNDKLIKSVMKTGHANERIIAGLNNKGKIVLSDANNKLLDLETNRIQDLHDIAFSTSNEIRSNSERNKLTNYAKELKSLISKKVTCHVCDLLPFKIQQFIIVYTFKYQKSFVLKQMMVDFGRSEVKVSSIMKYISNPNEYAKNWLKTFTEQTIFYKKRPKKSHIYAKMAKKEVENIYDDLKAAIASTKHRKGEINNLSDWAKLFLQHLKSMPLSSEDLGAFQSLSNVSINEFIDLFSSIFESMKREIVTNFKKTTGNDVKWREDPYNKIIECLWGCTEYCPFCHEPCQYSDIEHITHRNKHKCIQHRPLTVDGSIKSPNRYFKIINEDDPVQFWNYAETYIGWEIHPVIAASECKYWKWLICNRKDELRQFFSTNTNNIPQEWNYITEEEAIRSLDDIYICS